MASKTLDPVRDYLARGGKVTKAPLGRRSRRIRMRIAPPARGPLPDEHEEGICVPWSEANARARRRGEPVPPFPDDLLERLERIPDPEDDPWEATRRELNVVSTSGLGGDVGRVEAPAAPAGEERAEAPDLSAAIERMPAITQHVLTELEFSVVMNRVMGETYEHIAASHGLHDRSHTRQMEQRALKKLRKHTPAFAGLFKKKCPGA